MDEITTITNYNRLRVAMDTTDVVSSQAVQQALDSGATVDEMVQILKGDDKDE